MTSNSGKWLNDWLHLSKFNIMLPVGLTGFTGYIIFKPLISIDLVLVSLGIFLMAVSASVLNQIQEKDLDSKMNRTHDRPIPAGRISLKNAIIYSVFCLVTGTFLIYYGGNVLASLIGLFTVLWYNGVYTFSKRITSFAVVPGALTGALPPLIGWVAAGGGIWDKPIIFIEFLFFIGQVPHFWLLIVKYGEEYSKAEIPSLTDIFNTEQINRLTFTWVITSVMAAVFLCYLEVIRNGPVILVLLIASAFLIWKFSALLRTGNEGRTSKKYSILLDLYFLMILILLISDRVIG
jgi:heme o synthase